MPEDHNELELERLTHAIALSRGTFTFFFVRCDDPDEQKHWIERLQADLPTLCLRHVALEHQEDSLLLYLRRNPAPEPFDALCVTGLEKSVDTIYDFWSENFIRDLNLRRNSYPEEINCPLILLANLKFQKRLMQYASDFFSIRSSLFYLYKNIDLIDISDEKISKLKKVSGKVFRKLLDQYYNVEPEFIKYNVDQAIVSLYKDGDGRNFNDVEILESNLFKISRMNLIYNLKDYSLHSTLRIEDPVWVNIQKEFLLSSKDKEHIIISMLEPEDMKIFYMKRAGFSDAEISSRLDISRSRIVERLIRIKQKIVSANKNSVL